MDFDAPVDDELEEEEIREERGGCSGCLGRLFLLGFILLILVFASAVLFSSFLCSDKGNRWLARRINSAVSPAKITFAKATVKWFSPIQFENVRYADPSCGQEWTAETVRSNVGLFRLFPVGVMNIGTVTLKNPVFTVRPAKEQVQPEEGEGGGVFLPVLNFKGGVVIENGSLRVYPTETAEKPFTARQIVARLEAESFFQPLSVELSLWTGDKGRLTLQGTWRSLNEMTRRKEAKRTYPLNLAVQKIDVPELFGLLSLDVGAASGVADGEIQLERRGEKSYTVVGDLKVQKFSVAVDQKNVTKPTTLSLSSNLAVDPGNIRIHQLELVSPWLRVAGKGVLAPQQSGSIEGALQVKATGSLTQFSRDFRRTLKNVPPMEGNFQLDLSTQQYTDKIGVSAVMNVTDFYTAPEKGQATVIPQGTLRFDGMVPVGDEGALPEVRDGNWSVKFGKNSFDGSIGRWSWAGKKPQVEKLQVNLASDIAQALRLFGAWIAPDLQRAITSVSGRVDLSTTIDTGSNGKLGGKFLIEGQQVYGKKANGVIDLSFRGGKGSFTIPTEKRQTFLSDGAADTLVQVDSFNWCGFYVSESPVRFRYSPGLLRMECQANVNGGKLNLTPEMPLEKNKAIIRIPQKTRVLENVRITQELIDLWLVMVNPLFKGSRIQGGTVTADAIRFECDPSMPPEKGVSGEFDLEFRNLKLLLGPEFDEMLMALNANDRCFQAERLPVHITVQEGLVHLDKVKIVFDGQPIVLGGWTSFDGKIQYQMDVTLNERLFARWNVGALGKLFGGKTLPIMISGRVDNPKVELGGFAKALQGLVAKDVQLLAKPVQTKPAPAAQPAKKPAQTKPTQPSKAVPARTESKPAEPAPDSKRNLIDWLHQMKNTVLE
ncbi:MAG: hypothetical protein IJR99_02335 [Kiritimatiellae bacterium]|nr:hypothetical protein [Kiritimatiellia bacterium]